MKLKINDIEYCKTNSECNRDNEDKSIYWSCKDLCEDKFMSFEKNYSETIDLIFPNKELNKDNTNIFDEEYYYDNELKINIMPLKRYNENKEIAEKFTFLYLVIKYIRETDIFENEVRDYIVEKLDEYDEEIELETISYEDIIDVLMGFNDQIPDETLEKILLGAISDEFTSKIQIENTTLNIVDENIIKDIIRNRKEITKNIPDEDFNLVYDDWHSCSGCKYHNYSNGKNNCSLENCCDDYDEDNPCGDRE